MASTTFPSYSAIIADDDEVEVGACSCEVCCAGEGCAGGAGCSCGGFCSCLAGAGGESATVPAATSGIDSTSIAVRIGAHPLTKQCPQARFKNFDGMCLD